VVVIKISHFDFVIIVVLDFIISLRLKGNSLAPYLALFHENLVGSPVDRHACVCHLVSEGRDCEWENFSREMGVPIEVVRSGV